MRASPECRHSLMRVLEGNVGGGDSTTVGEARQHVVGASATRAGSGRERHAICRAPPELRSAARHDVAVTPGDHFADDERA